MKILIADDMEGITGVVDWKHVDSTHPEYQRFRRIMTADVNAAIRGAFAGGADQVAVADGHGGKTNLLIEEIDERARINAGSPSPYGMVEGIAEGVDAVLFVGYHARNGARGAILAHTWSSAVVANVWLNDRVVGEIGLNASVCGQHGAPVLMISGDRAACAEACDWIPGIQTAVVKYPTAYSAAECLPPAVSQKLIEATAEKVVRSFTAGQAPAPLVTPAPVKIAVEFFNSGMADKAALVPGAVRKDDPIVEFTAPDMLTAYRYFRVAVSLA